MQSLCGTDCCSKCSRQVECVGCQNVKGHPFNGNCIVVECIERDGHNGFLRFKERLISEINALEINERIEYSSCSWERRWNIKFKKAGKTLCTIYPKEYFFTVMAVVGIKEKASVETILPECTAELQNIYHQTQEGNGQRSLMIDLEDKEDLYNDLLRLIQIRRNS